jgi:glycosyltransferase involved in cell wall biosynthesis
VSDSRPRVTILIGAFWPGHEATGPNLSIKAMCEILAGDFEFRIIARDRPFGAREPMIDSDLWHDLGYAQARFLPVGPRGAQHLNRVLNETASDLIVLNGFFDKEFTIPTLLKEAMRTSKRAILLSPRGEFSEGAISLKPNRKRAYLGFARAFGLLKGVAIHATSDAEVSDLRRAFPGHDIHLVTNFRPLFDLPVHQPRLEGEPLRLAFVGRISPVKGLDFALDVLAKVPAPVRYDIFGPQSEAEYWQACQRKISAMPSHIDVRYRGEISNAQVALELAAQDCLFLPSKSENFGHAIFESLAAGTPVLIGDQTPWRDLEAAKAGFDLPLDRSALFVEAITRFSAEPDPAAWRRAARDHAERFVANSEAPSKMRALFHTLISQHAS